MSSIQDFSVAIGIESGNASNVEKVLKNLERIKKLDKEIKGSKLAQDLADFDLTKLSKDAGFDEIRERLESANESLRSMLEKTDTMDAVFRSGGIMTGKMDALKQELTDALNATKSDMQSNVNSVKKNVGRLKDKLREISEGVEAILNDAVKGKDLVEIKEGLKTAGTQWEGVFTALDQTMPTHTTAVKMRIAEEERNLAALINTTATTMMKAIKDMVDGISAGKGIESLTKEVQAMHDSVRTVKTLVTNSLVKALASGTPPGSTYRPPPPGYPQVPPPGPPAAPAAGIALPAAPGAPAIPPPTVRFNDLGRPYVGTDTQKRILGLEEAQKMYERNVPVGGGKTPDDLKAWIDAQLKDMKKDIIAEVKKEREKEPVGDSVLGEGDVR
jgi:hypothetical protein